MQKSGKIVFDVHLKKLMLEKAAKTGETVTQTEVSKETGLSAVTIGRWYSGKVSRIEGETVLLLTRYFGIPLSDLVSIRYDQGAQS